jgi:phage-related protein
MKNLPLAIRRAAHSFTQGSPWLVLVTLYLSEDEEPLRICNNNEDITYAGDVYYAFPFELGEISEDNKGKVPEVKLSVGNAGRTLMKEVEQYDGGMEMSVKLSIVHAGSLSEDHSALDMWFSIVSTSYNAEWIIFSLGVANPLRMRFPVHRYIKNYCRFVAEFKREECQYSGSDISCNGTLEDCKSKGNELRFGGFPGLATKIKVV